MESPSVSAGWSSQIKTRTVTGAEFSTAVTQPGGSDAERDRLVAEISRLVGHAVLNDLTIVRLFAETIRQGLDGSDPLHAQVSRISEVTVHSSEMLQLLGLLSRDAGDRRAVDLGQLVGGLVVLLRAVAAPARVVIDVPEGPVRCWLDVDQTRRSIVGLVAEARRGIGPDGRVYVSVAFGDGGASVVVSSTSGARLSLPLDRASSTDLGPAEAIELRDGFGD